MNETILPLINMPTQCGKRWYYRRN